MKSNYEHFVLTASGLKAGIWSTAQGRPAFIFRTVTHPDAMMPSCVKPHPTDHFPNQRLLILFLFLGARNKISIWGPSCRTSKSTTAPSVLPAWPEGSSLGPLEAVPVQNSPCAASGAVQGSRRSGLSLPTARESHRHRRMEVQAQTAPTQPSARIQSTTGGIRGFRRLIAEFTFIQSIRVRRRERGGLT